MNDFQRKVEALRKKQEELQNAAKVEFGAFIKENFPLARMTSSGLCYIVEAEGGGPQPTPHQTVSVHYTGKLTDGTIFDSSYKRNQPISFPLGMGRVIKGWDEGIAMMKTGGKTILIIPYFLAYGEQGRPPVIPSRATLIFHVELVAVQ